MIIHYDTTLGWVDENDTPISLVVEVGRDLLRQGTRQQVETDGSANSNTLYAGELFYDLTDGHVWVGDGASQVKFDVRGLQHLEGILQTYEGQIQLY